MALLKKRILGKPTGVVGDINFRYKDGNTIISERVMNYAPPMDELSVNRRNRFGLTGKFSSAVNKLSAFKKMWDMVTPDTISPFNGIFKANYPYVTPTDVSSIASLTPIMTGFDVTTTDVTIDGTSVEVSIDPIGNNAEIDTAIEKFIQLGAVIKCTDPTTDGTKIVDFISLASANVVLNLANPLSFSINLSDQRRNVYALYDTHLTFMSFVTLTDSGMPVHYSNGFTA